jgi:RNA 2',3'-cyclic 3'-phosphodiesterase
MVLGSFMRLFTGIALAPPVIERLSAALEELRRTARIKWSPIENLHITCRFIGAWPEDHAEDLRTALSAITVAGSFPIGVAKFGFFPNPHHPHLLFAGVQVGTQLPALAAAIDQALQPLGLAAETRPYRPHVTLARIKADDDIRGLREHIAAMTDFDFGAFEAQGFHLYESRASAHGSVYTKLATYDLMRENKTIS